MLLPISIKKFGKKKIRDMKPLSELRNRFMQESQSINYQLWYLAERIIDYDVYLPTHKRNLQRPFVWSLEQNRELIISMLTKRTILPLSILIVYDKSISEEDIMLIIDGKQRLNAMLSFYKNEYTIEIEGREYFFNDLPKEYQQAIKGFYIDANIVYDKIGEPVKDQDKIDWFLSINYAGTPQDESYLQELSKLK